MAHPFITDAQATQKIQEIYNDIVNSIGTGFQGAITIAGTPTEAGIYIPTEAGVYPNAGGLEYAPEGDDEGVLVMFINNGSEWVKSDYPLPMLDLSGLATKEEVMLRDSFLIEQKNKINYKSMFEAGAINPDTLEHSSTLNQLRTKWIDIPDEWIGKEFTLSGFGRLRPGAGARYVIRNVNGVVLASELGSDSDYTPVTFTFPQDSHELSIGIANLPNIGEDPLDNEFTNTLMLNEGSTAEPFEPYNELIDSEKINFDFDNVVKESSLSKIREVESWLVPSLNKINYKSMFELGGYHPVTGNHFTSLNQLRTKWIDIPDEWIGKEFTLSGFGRLGTGAGARVVIKDINDNNLVLIVGSEHDLTPVTFTFPQDAVKVGFGIVNDSNGIEDPLDNEFTNTLMLNEGSTAEPFEQYGNKIPKKYIENDSTDSLNDLSKIIIVKTSATDMRLYYYAGGNTSVWFSIGFKRVISTTKFVDVWRIEKGWRCDRVSEFGFLDKEEIIKSGVWENAIYTDGEGYNDALGSSHGCELLNSASMTIDGVEMDLSESGNYKAKEFKVITETRLLTADGVATRAISKKEWTFAGSKIRTTNEIDWKLQTNILERSHIAMLPINREDSGVQITNRAMRDPEWDLVDVSKEGFSNYLRNDRINNSNTIVIEGEFVYCEMVIVKANPLLQDRGIWMQNNSLYNKIYFQLGSTTVQAGDIWDIDTIYNIRLR